MSSPEVARLSRRMDEQDDTIRAIGDTLLDIKDTVDQHTETLAVVLQSQVQMQQTQAQQGELLVEILRRLGTDPA